MIPDELKLRCSTCGQEIDSLLSHICQQPAEPLGELAALHQRVAELEADNQRLLNCYTHYKRALGDVAKITTQDFVGRLVYLALVNEPKE